MVLHLPYALSAARAGDQHQLALVLDVHGGPFITLAERALEPLGLKGRHLAVLTLITEHRLSQQDLSLHTGLDRTTMVTIMDDLERGGLAEAGRLLDAAERELFEQLAGREWAQLDEVSGRLLAHARDSGAVPNWSPEV